MASTAASPPASSLLETLVLGRSRFGVVAQIVQQTGHGDLVMKIVTKSLVHEWAVVSASTLTVANELHWLNTLRHEHLIHAVWYTETADCIYLGMPHMLAGDLCVEIIKNGPYDEDDAILLCGQIVSGIGYMHDAGVAHRDIKPDNVGLSVTDRPTQRAKILDLGLVRACDYTSGCHTLCGTPLYLAPEVLWPNTPSARNYGRQADMWSFGVLMYSMFTATEGWELSEADDAAATEIDFRDPVWLGVTQGAMDMISGLLCRDPAVRTGVGICREETWLAQSEGEHLNRMAPLPRSKRSRAVDV